MNNLQVDSPIQVDSWWAAALLEGMRPGHRPSWTVGHGMAQLKGDFEK